jgi:DNA-nicking Smr family endonuclease
MTRRRPRPPSRRVPEVETWQRPNTLPADEERELLERAVEAIDPQALRSALVGKGRDELARRDEAAPPARRTGRRGQRHEDAPRATLDLHGRDRASALEQLERFLAAQPNGAKALVVHGRGEQILAGVVTRFLDRHPRVREHVEAPRRWGGAGARWVTMR